MRNHTNTFGKYVYWKHGYPHGSTEMKLDDRENGTLSEPSFL